jgi:hypothetical protein
MCGISLCFSVDKKWGRVPTGGKGTHPLLDEENSRPGRLVVLMDGVCFHGKNWCLFSLMKLKLIIKIILIKIINPSQAFSQDIENLDDRDLD